MKKVFRRNKQKHQVSLYWCSMLKESQTSFGWNTYRRHKYCVHTCIAYTVMGNISTVSSSVHSKEAGEQNIIQTGLILLKFICLMDLCFMFGDYIYLVSSRVVEEYVAIYVYTYILRYKSRYRFIMLYKDAFTQLLQDEKEKEF